MVNELSNNLSVGPRPRAASPRVTYPDRFVRDLNETATSELREGRFGPALKTDTGISTFAAGPR